MSNINKWEAFNYSPSQVLDHIEKNGMKINKAEMTHKHKRLIKTFTLNVDNPGYTKYKKIYVKSYTEDQKDFVDAGPFRAKEDEGEKGSKITQKYNFSVIIKRDSKMFKLNEKTWTDMANELKRIIKNKVNLIKKLRKQYNYKTGGQQNAQVNARINNEILKAETKDLDLKLMSENNVETLESYLSPNYDLTNLLRPLNFISFDENGKETIRMLFSMYITDETKLDTIPDTEENKWKRKGNEDKFKRFVSYNNNKKPTWVDLTDKQIILDTLKNGSILNGIKWKYGEIMNAGGSASYKFLFTRPTVQKIWIKEDKSFKNEGEIKAHGVDQYNFKNFKKKKADELKMMEDAIGFDEPMNIDSTYDSYDHNEQQTLDFSKKENENIPKKEKKEEEKEDQSDNVEDHPHYEPKNDDNIEKEQIIGKKRKLEENPFSKGKKRKSSEVVSINDDDGVDEDEPTSKRRKIQKKKKKKRKKS
jgi:hypothetical protein